MFSTIIIQLLKIQKIDEIKLKKTDLKFGKKIKIKLVH